MRKWEKVNVCKRFSSKSHIAIYCSADYTYAASDSNSNHNQLIEYLLEEYLWS